METNPERSLQANRVSDGLKFGRISFTNIDDDIGLFEGEMRMAKISHLIVLGGSIVDLNTVLSKWTEW